MNGRLKALLVGGPMLLGARAARRPLREGSTPGDPGLALRRGSSLLP
jgi:hypothetical protein